jgi:hypothetical protein
MKQRPAIPFPPSHKPAATATPAPHLNFANNGLITANNGLAPCANFAKEKNNTDGKEK